MSNNAWLRKQCTNFLDSKLTDPELFEKAVLIRRAATKRGISTDEVSQMYRQIKQELEDEKTRLAEMAKPPVEATKPETQAHTPIQSSNSRTEPHGKPERASNRHNPAPSGTVRTGPTGTRKTGAWKGPSILDMADERKV